MSPIASIGLCIPSSDGTLGCDSRCDVEGPGPTSHCFHSGLTVLDASGPSLQLGFATEGASELGMLTDLIFFTIF